jgi:preprotein translocase subunit SecF
MAVVVFFIFRTTIPSLAVILSAFADIVLTLALVDYLGISLSSAGIVAFLMIIGYSVDTDIMLTSHLLKRRDASINSRLMTSLKTGLTMTLTSIVAVLIAFFITASFSEVLRQIFLILIIGLSFDIMNTWLMNATILRWYVERKQRRSEQ